MTPAGLEDEEENKVLMLYTRGLKLKLPGGRWRQYLGEAGPHQVFHKKNFAKKSFSQVCSQPATHGDVISLHMCAVLSVVLCAFRDLCSRYLRCHMYFAFGHLVIDK